MRSRESKPRPPALQAELILPRSKGEGGALLYFAYMYLSIALCGLEKQVVVPASSLGQFASEWRRLGTERTVAQVPGDFFREPWQVTSHKSHIFGFQTFGVLPPPSTLPSSWVTHSHFLSALIIKAKKINLIFSWPRLVGVYNLIPRSCHQFDQEVFIYNT